MTSRAISRILAAATAMMLMQAVPAVAQDAEAVAARLKQALAEQGTNITWDSISGVGSQIVLVGVKGGPDGKAPIGDITLDDVSDDGKGGYRIGTASLPEYSLSRKGNDVKVSNITLTGVLLPAEGAEGLLGDMMIYEGASIERLTVDSGGKNFFSMSNLDFEITIPDEDTPMSFSGGAKEFFADLSVKSDPKTTATLTALGYQQITGSFDLMGSWVPADGTMEFTQQDITVDDVGTLGITFDIGGMTPEMNKKMREIQAEITANPKLEKQKQSEMNALLGSLTLRSASISFDDDGMTGKLLDFFAAQQNMSREQLVAQSKVVVPFVIMQLGSPELAQAAGAAIGKFLDDPKHITMSAEPAEEVSFTTLMMTGVTSPRELPSQLNLTITANE